MIYTDWATSQILLPYMMGCIPLPSFYTRAYHPDNYV